MSFPLSHGSIRALEALFRTLPAPDDTDLRGSFRASFVGPALIRWTARPTLALTGLPGWYGKRFLDARNATNLLDRGGTLREHLAMEVTEVVSYVDGRPGRALTYPARDGRPAPLPWRWVRDEMRRFDERTILAFTFVDRPLVRRIGFPFLLVREE